jgi:hypothetical protein
MTATTKKRHGVELRNDLLAAIERRKEQEAERNRRIDNCEVEWTDCFLSINACDLMMRVDKLKIEILDRGGLWPFPALLNPDGTDSGAFQMRTRYGWVWNLNGSFLGSKKKIKAANLTEAMIDKPAWATQNGHAPFAFPSNFNYWTGEDV